MSIEFYYTSVVKVTDLLKTCLEDVSFHVPIYFYENFQFIHYLAAYGAN